MDTTDCRCGGKPQIIKDGAHWFVQCAKCNGRTNAHNTERDAIHRWNMGFVFELGGGA